MAMKKLAAVAALAVALFGAGSALSQENKDGFVIIPIWSHTHTNLEGDDGSHAPSETKEYLQANKYGGVIFTPHTSARLPFPEIRRLADMLTETDFLAVGGREVSARVVREEDQEGKLMCHLNAVGDIDDILVRDGQFDSKELDALLAKLDEEGAYYWWNHPWTCPQWSPLANKFYGIEMFNNIGTGYADGSSYAMTRDAYLAALKGGKKLFVTSGIDMHMLAQTHFADFYTHVLADEFARESLKAGMLAGHTIAGFNAKLLFISARPSFKPAAAPGATFSVKGGVAIKTVAGVPPSLVVYKNGEEAAISAPPVLEKRGKAAKGYLSFELSFGDTLRPGETACYVFEIPRYMISSPYCYEAEK